MVNTKSNISVIMILYVGSLLLLWDYLYFDSVAAAIAHKTGPDGYD